MNSLQTVIIESIEKRIEKREGLTPASEKMYANIGNVLVLDSVNLNVIGRVHYEFQAGRYHLWYRVGGDGKTWRSNESMMYDGVKRTNAAALGDVNLWLDNVIEEWIPKG